MPCFSAETRDGLIRERAERDLLKRMRDTYKLAKEVQDGLLKCKIGTRIKVYEITIQKMLDIPEWRRRLVKAPTMTDAEKVLISFCKSKGIQLHHDVVTGKLVQTKP